MCQESTDSKGQIGKATQQIPAGSNYQYADAPSLSPSLLLVGCICLKKAPTLYLDTVHLG